MTLAIGIDLGTTNSVAAIAGPGRVELARGAGGERIHPSVVSFPETGQVLVGAQAAVRRVVDPANTVHSAKRLIGQNIRAPMVQLALTSLPFEVDEGPNQQPIIAAGGRHLTVPEISAQVLHYLQRLASEQFGPVSQAVITVPANFSDAQRQATKEAGRLAGLEVLRLVNEPTAAALAYGHGHALDELVAVFDFGGGTFDISILRIKSEVFEVMATDGDFFLGGDDLDRALAEHLASELTRTRHLDAWGSPLTMTRLMLAAEQIKRHLSTESIAEGTVDRLIVEGQPEPVALPFQISRDQFDHLIAGYVDRTIDVCRNVLTAARLEPHDLSEVICVGGSTRVPLVRERIAELFQREPSIGINPDEVVAQGAAIQAATLAGQLGAPTPQRATRPDPAPAPPAAAAASGVSATLALSSDYPVPESGPPARPAAPRTGPDRPAAGPPASTPVLMDVTPASLRVATAGGYSEPIIERNAPIPIEHTKAFTTAHDNQTRVVIDVCRGEERSFEANELLGSLVLDGLAEAERGQTRIAVTFRVDADGILHVKARDQQTGQAQEARLTILGAPVDSPASRPESRMAALFNLKRGDR